MAGVAVPHNGSFEFPLIGSYLYGVDYQRIVFCDCERPVCICGRVFVTGYGEQDP